MPGEEAVIEFDTSKAGPGYMQSEILTQYGEVKSVAEHTDKRLEHFLNVGNERKSLTPNQKLKKSVKKTCFWKKGGQASGEGGKYLKTTCIVLERIFADLLGR